MLKLQNSHGPYFVQQPKGPQSGGPYPYPEVLHTLTMRPLPEGSNGIKALDTAAVPRKFVSMQSRANSGANKSPFDATPALLTRIVKLGNEILAHVSKSAMDSASDISRAWKRMVAS